MGARLQSADFEENFNQAMQDCYLRPIAGKLKLDESVLKKFYKFLFKLIKTEVAPLISMSFLRNFPLTSQGSASESLKQSMPLGRRLRLWRIFVGVYNYCSYDKVKLQGSPSICSMLGRVEKLSVARL